MFYLVTLMLTATQSPATSTAGAHGASVDPQLTRLWARTYLRSPMESSFTTCGAIVGAARYFLAGNVTSGSGNTWTPWLLSLDQGGGVAWQREYSVQACGFSRTSVHALAPGFDGGAYVAGIVTCSPSAWIAKTDQAGLPLWARSVSVGSAGGGYYTGDPGSSELSVVATDLSSGPALFLTTNSTVGAATTDDASLIRFDQGGGVVFERSYHLDPASNGGQEAEEVARSLAKTPDGGSCLGIYVADSTLWSYSAVSRTGPDGALLWSRSIRTNPYWDAYTSPQWSPIVSSAHDGGCFVLTTNAYTAGSPITRMSVLRLAPDGTAVWGYDYRYLSSSLVAFGTSIETTNDGGVFVGGRAFTSTGSSDEMWIARLAQDGSVLWWRTFGRADRNEAAMQITAAYDGGVFVAAQTAAYPGLPGQQADWQRLWGIKLWPDGSTAFNVASGINVLPQSVQRTPTSLIVQAIPLLSRTYMGAVTPVSVTSSLTTSTVTQQAP